MTGRLKFLLLYYVGWMLFFELARLVFIFYNYLEAAPIGISTMSLSCLYGLRMDASMAAYLLSPVCILVLVGWYLSSLRLNMLIKVYTWVLLFFILPIIFSDLEIYKAWGFRIDSTPLKYLDAPHEAWASISHLPLLWIGFLFIITYFFLVILSRKYLNRILRLLDSSSPKLITTMAVVFFTFLLILPVRGGIQLTPMNQSMVYFSKENFANLASINATWNFLYSLVNNRDSKNPNLYLEQNRARQLVDSLFESGDSNTQVLKISKPNVIVVIWESFTEKATHVSIQGKQVTPGFNDLKKQGLYFSRLYASGDRTDKGLAAVLSGYPALNNFSIIFQPAKSGKLPSLARYFKNIGYTDRFYYGGEPEFANIKSYVLQSGYDKLIEKKDFPANELNSKWGAHDSFVADKLLTDLSSCQQPFFATWLTLSSHEPFETPELPFFNGKDITTRFLNSIHYTDEVLYHLVQQSQMQPWWNNTLMIIVADHGHPLPDPSNKLDNFKIPMLWLGGALNWKGKVCDRVGSQLDVATTLINQIQPHHSDFPFSKNLMNPTSRSWAYYSFNNGFGLVQPDRSFVFDNIGKQVVLQQGPLLRQDIEAGKAMQQFTYQDYLDK